MDISSRSFPVCGCRTGFIRCALRAFLVRQVLRSIRQLKRNPALQRVEQLESRLCLSGSAYATAGGDWFGSLETSLQSVRSLTGSSEFVGPLPPGVIAHQYLVRLTPEAAQTAGSLAGVEPLIAGSSVTALISRSRLVFGTDSLFCNCGLSSALAANAPPLVEAASSDSVIALLRMS